MSLIKWFFESTIHFGSKSIALREVVGGVLGLSSAILGARRKVAAWPVGILGDALLFTVFLGAVFAYGDQPSGNFYAQDSRNLLLIIVSVYGWIRWAQHRKANGAQKPAVVPRWTTVREKQILVPVIVLFFLISMQIFKGVPFAFKNGDYPTGTLYAIYLPFVLWGFFSWLRISKQEKLSTAI